MKTFQEKLSEIILKNEGNHDGLMQDLLELVQPIYNALFELTEPSGAYSKDPLTHANNTINATIEIAKDALKDFKKFK